MSDRIEWSTDFLAAGYDPDEDPKPSDWEDGWE